MSLERALIERSRSRSINIDTNFVW